MAADIKRPNPQTGTARRHSLHRKVRPGLHTALKSEQRFLLRAKVFFGDDALSLEFRQRPKLLFEIWRLR